MAIARVTTIPTDAKHKVDRYKHLDIHHKNNKYLLLLKIISGICIISIICNIALLLKN